jgi:SAM-dependent methyltransferase
MAELTDTNIRELVRERYAAAARSIASAEPAGEGCCGSAATAGSSCCGPVSLEDAAGHEVFGGSLYQGEAGTEDAPVQASLGCGVPTAVADLHDGDVVLDLGSGAGADVLISARRVAPSGRAIGLDMTDEMLELARANAAAAGVANAAFVKGYLEQLPLADASVDVVICSQLLHHFTDAEIPDVLRELDRVARRRVIVSDLRRSWLAACGFWLVTWPLGFHPVTRHDGFVSVLRGFTARELSSHVLAATGQRAELRRHIGFRLTASWGKTA